MSKGTTIRMWRRGMFILVVLIVLGFGVSAFRLMQLQLFQGEMLSQMALEQQLKDTKINAQRGTIYDCNMRPLAQSATVWTVALESAYLKDEAKREKICENLSQILEIDKSELLEKAKKRSYHVVIKRKVESDVKDRVVNFMKENKITAGIKLIQDYKRYYPYGDFASCAIGFTGTDSQGLSGLENYYDEYLTGKHGRLITARNAKGTDMPFEYEKMVPAKSGNNLVLCIDERIQHFLEKHLAQGVIDNKVMNRAVAVAMDVNTGGILGMAVKGGYDLNKPFEITEEGSRAAIETLPQAEQAKAKGVELEKQWRNKSVSDTYMPGSVFKMVTTAMAFEENLINENTSFNCSGSYVPFNGAKPIRCHKKGGHGTQTFVQALCNSCNPVFIMLGQKLGPEKFYQYYRSFGFTEKTGIDLPAEANGIFFNKDGKMGPMDLAVASFGQNFSITPMQMLCAASAIANGGNLVTPHVVNQIIDSDGNVVKSIQTVNKRKVISEDTAKRICAMLQQNATTGTAKNGYVPGYRVAGKTGTSQKIGCSGENGMDYIASYCGFAPAEKPQIALLVFFDTPKGDSYYGGAIAGPTFSNIMKDILPYLGVECIYTEEELLKLDIKTPFLVNLKIGAAKELLNSKELNSVVYGSGETVIAQVPDAQNSMPKGGTVVLYTDKDSFLKEVEVPNLVGMSISAANKTASDLGLNISIKGANLKNSALVSVLQSIAPGTKVKPGTVISLEFAATQAPAESD